MPPGGPGGPMSGRRGRGCSSDRPDPGLKLLAEEGGGGYFELNRTADLADTFARVANELHRQYLLAFTPPVLDGKVHTLEVKVRPAGLKARARRSYVAPTGK